jgi:hypothetical protein
MPEYPCEGPGPAAGRAAREDPGRFVPWRPGTRPPVGGLGVCVPVSVRHVRQVGPETGLAEELFATADPSSVPDWQAPHVAEAELTDRPARVAMRSRAGWS